MFPILLAGSLLFYLVLGVIGLTVTVLVISEKERSATILLIATLVGLYFLTDLGLMNWIAAHPTLILGGVAAYLSIGIVWVYPKWMSFYNDVFDVATDARQAAKAAHQRMVAAHQRISGRLADEPPSLAMVEGYEMAAAVMDKFGRISLAQPPSGNQFQSYADITLANFAPQVGVNKARILAWMSYWPISMFWTLLNDPIRRFYQWVYRSISGSLQRMSDAKFADPK